MKKTLLLIISFLICTFSLFGQTEEQGQTSGAEDPIFENATLILKNQVELFPNPAEEFIMVKITNSELADAKLEMHSVIGSVITIEPELVGNDTYRIPVETFASGYYFVVIKDEVTRYKRAFKFLKN